MRLEVLDINVNLVDFAFADVDENVRVMTRLATLKMRAIELARAARPGRSIFAATSVTATALGGTPAPR